jgi:hypothetical protein
MPARMNKPLFQKGTLDQGASPNQRRFRRYDLTLSCRVKPRKSRRDAVLPELMVETLDVSSGGVFFSASTDWAIGTPIEFDLDLPAVVIGRPVRIRCQGTITRVMPQEGGRVGVGATIDRYEFAPSTAQVD